MIWRYVIRHSYLLIVFMLIGEGYANTAPVSLRSYQYGAVSEQLGWLGFMPRRYQQLHPQLAEGSPDSVS